MSWRTSLAGLLAGLSFISAALAIAALIVVGCGLLYLAVRVARLAWGAS